eukprot:gene37035-45682_t
MKLLLMCFMWFHLTQHTTALITATFSSFVTASSQTVPDFTLSSLDSLVIDSSSMAGGDLGRSQSTQIVVTQTCQYRFEAPSVVEKSFIFYAPTSNVTTSLVLVRFTLTPSTGELSLRAVGVGTTEDALGSDCEAVNTAWILLKDFSLANKLATCLTCEGVGVTNIRLWSSSSPGESHAQHRDLLRIKTLDTYSNAYLTHRYSFNDGTARDSVGGLNLTLVSGATVTNGHLNLNSALGSYAVVPGNMWSTTSLSLELWFTSAVSQLSGYGRMLQIGQTAASSSVAMIIYKDSLSGNLSFDL